MTREPVVICVCGMSGSGKSTLAKRLARKYGLNYHSGGDTLKCLAIENGYKPVERGWWESKEGERFLENRAENYKFDKTVDKKLLELARQGDVVFDSWTMPWLLEKGFKMWLEASPEKRAKRIARRNGTSVKEALKALQEKEGKTRAIFKELYGFSLGEDLKPFHLILDTDNLEIEEVFEVISMVIDNMVLKLGNRHKPLAASRTRL